jgi:hypothetical protein
VEQWANGLGKGGFPVFTLLCPVPAYRQEVFSWLPKLVKANEEDALSWAENSFVTSFLSRTKSQRLLNALLATDSFVLESPLATLVDRGFYLVSDAFKAIVEARFRVNEGAQLGDLAHDIMHWMDGGSVCGDVLKKARVRRVVTSNQDKLDLRCFLLTLSFQSGLIGPSVLTFDNVDQAATAIPTRRKSYLKELLDILQVVERWSKLGCPLGLAVGLNVDLEELKKTAPKVHGLLARGVPVY